jgi:sirohydrochlorin cobaltochelatase
MKRSAIVAMVVTLSLLCALGCAIAGGHGAATPVKKGILVVVFGTSIPEARKAFDQIDKQVKAAFPEVQVRWAYTSKIIREKLAKEGEKLDSPVMALAKMSEDDFTHVLVASFHTIAGEEFHDLHVNAHLFDRMEGGMKRVLVSRPLLSSREDNEKTLKAVLKEVPKARKPEDAVILMGHGSEHHPADSAYAALNYWASLIDPNLFVGTVEGQPTLDDFLPALKEKGVKKVYLLPFMSVAGDHARNDMCGSEEDSWASVLKKNGYDVECVLKGTAQIPEVVDIWIDHMKAAFSHFE